MKINILFIGQVCRVKKLNEDLLAPSIYLGLDTFRNHKFRVLNPDRKTLRENTEYTDNGVCNYVELIKEKDKTSPSGERIVYGPFCKWIKGPFKVKGPEDATLIKELSKIESLNG